MSLPQHPAWLLRRSAGILLLLLIAMPLKASAQEAAPKPGHIYQGARTILSTATTVTGETIHYPAGAPAKITAVEITLQPGQQTGWHTHPVPLFGYVLEGELTIDYGPKGQRVFRKGDALAEAMNEAHNGRNTGKGPMRILAVFIGVEGGPGTVSAPPPARQQ